MTALAAAIDDLFADPELAQGALWRPGGTGAGVPVRVILRRPDRIGDWGATRLVSATTVAEVRTAEAPTLAEGDTLEVAGEVLVVQGEPLRDAERLVWTAEARPA